MIHSNSEMASHRMDQILVHQTISHEVKRKEYVTIALTLSCKVNLSLQNATIDHIRFYVKSILKLLPLQIIILWKLDVLQLTLLSHRTCSQSKNARVRS